MCLATPCKIKKIEGDWATVQGEAHEHRANLSLVGNAEVGDYVLVHGDMILNKLKEEEAKKILEMINNFNNNEGKHEHKK